MAYTSNMVSIHVPEIYIHTYNDNTIPLTVNDIKTNERIRMGLCPFTAEFFVDGSRVFSIRIP